MMVTVRSLGLTGITGYEVSVECFLSGGLPGFDVVGLPDAAVKESRERVRAAVKNCGAKFPVSRITVNLAPARVRKEGTVYDLPILLGILAAAEEISPLPQGAAFLGELSLSGALRPVTGVLPMALTAARLGIDTLYVPEANAAEATLADGLTVYGVTDVGQLIAHLKGEQVMTPAPRWTPGHQDRPLPDFADVMGQENVKRALETLRQPLEDGFVTITRASGSLTLPSRFMLVCAMNPCRCGWYGHPSGRCTCSPQQVEQYMQRISGPLLDRIDMHIDVPSVEYEAMRRKEQPEPSSAIRERVNAAREVQKKRFAGTEVSCNAYMTPAMIGTYCALDAAGEKLMQGAFERLGLTARSHDRILRMARTIADLEGSESIEAAHLAEAIQYRSSSTLK